MIATASFLSSVVILSIVNSKLRNKLIVINTTYSIPPPHHHAAGGVFLILLNAYYCYIAAFDF